MSQRCVKNYEGVMTSNKRRSDVLMLSCATKNLESRYRYTNQLKAEYARKKGYEYKFFELKNDQTDPHNARINLIKTFLDDYKYVVYLDDDAWVHNFDIKIEDIYAQYDPDQKYSLLIARGHNNLNNPKEWIRAYVNTGVLFFRGNETSKKILSEWMDVSVDGFKAMDAVGSLFDQGYFVQNLLFNEFFKDNIKIVDPYKINNSALIKLRDKDIKDQFILHACGLNFDPDKKYVKFNNIIKKSFDRNNIPFQVYDDKKEAKKILVISAATENLKKQYLYTNKIKEKYCEKHGYDFIFESLYGDPKIATNEKTNLIKKYIEKYDYVVWMDTDAWFHNFEIKLESIIEKWSNDETALIVARDHKNINSANTWMWCYVNAGVLIVKNCKSGLELLDEWQNSKNNPDILSMFQSHYPTLKDQPPLCGNILFNPKFRTKVSVIPYKEMNFFPFLNRQKQNYSDVFILHCVATKTDADYPYFYNAINDTIKKNNLDINLDNIRVWNSKTVDQKMKKDLIIRKLDSFVPAGFDYKPTLRPAADYNKPFGLIDWN